MFGLFPIIHDHKCHDKAPGNSPSVKMLDQRHEHGEGFGGPPAFASPPPIPQQAGTKSAIGVTGQGSIGTQIFSEEVR